MIEIVSSTTGAAEKALVLPSEDLFPARIRSRSARTDTPSLPSRATGRSLTIVLRGQQITFRELCRSSTDALRVYFAVSFLYDFFIVWLVGSSLRFSSILVMSRLVSSVYKVYDFLIATSIVV